LISGKLTESEDMPDEVRAKLHKAIGYALNETDKPAALEHLIRALNLHEKVGVKKDIEVLEREIKNATKTSTETLTPETKPSEPETKPDGDQTNTATAQA